MKKIKEIYSQPQCETLVVRFEGNIMSPAYGAKGKAGQQMVDDDDYTYSL